MTSLLYPFREGSWAWLCTQRSFLDGSRDYMGCQNRTCVGSGSVPGRSWVGPGSAVYKAELSTCCAVAPVSPSVFLRWTETETNAQLRVLDCIIFHTHCILNSLGDWWPSVLAIIFIPREKIRLSLTRGSFAARASHLVLLPSRNWDVGMWSLLIVCWREGCQILKRGTAGLYRFHAPTPPISFTSLCCHCSCSYGDSYMPDYEANTFGLGACWVFYCHTLCL